MTSDLQAIGIKDKWYKVAQDCRKEWYDVCRDGIGLLVEKTRSVCAVNQAKWSGDYPCPCGKTFCRKGDLTCHSHFYDRTPV